MDSDSVVAKVKVNREAVGVEDEDEDEAEDEDQEDQEPEPENTWAKIVTFLSAPNTIPIAVLVGWTAFLTFKNYCSCP